MKALAVSLVLAASSSAALAGGPAPILGGTKATLDQFPTVVALEVGGGLCTGTLLTKDWVLTAAHCVSPAVLGMTQAQITATTKVHLGTVNIRSGGTTVGASETIPHPSFSINALGTHDIGLIKLATPVVERIPVPVNFKAEDAHVGLDVTMVGFGMTGTGGSGGVGIEYVVEQTVISCQAGVGSNANLLCFNQITGKGKCEGDSGGPSFAMVNGKMVQVGITSFGDQDCAQFGADTRIDAEKDFLTQHVPNLECDSDDDCATGSKCFQNACITTPFTETGLGADCVTNADCESGACGNQGDAGKCTMGCTVGAADACPTGLECVTAGTTGACWPTPSDDGGCSSGRSDGSRAPFALLGLGVLGVLARRRRR